MNDAPSSLVSPGIWGFLAFFVLAVALYLLMRNMNARMRKMSYRAEELRRQAEAEAAERKAPKEGRGQRPGGRASGDDEGDGPEQTGDPQP